MNSNTINKCEYCCKEFKKRSNYVRHKKTVHSRSVNGEFLPEREKLFCVLCKKQYSAKSSLDYHVRTAHLDEAKSCSCCDFKTIHKSVLEKHVRRHQEKKGDSDKSCIKPFKCSDCGVAFTQKNSLNFHKRKKHNINNETVLYRKKCPLCSFVALGRSIKSINLHFKDSHGITLKFEKHHFNSVEDFNTWKDNIEKYTVSSFIKKDTYSKDGISTCSTYQCHRTDIFKIKTLNKRRLKTSGSCKINGFCPASIKTTIDDRGLHVVYLSSHVGHKHELKYLRKRERESIAIQLARWKNTQ